MSFVPDINTALGALILGGVVRIFMSLRRIDRMVWQHELMWRDYVSRKELYQNWKETYEKP